MQIFQPFLNPEDVMPFLEWIEKNRALDKEAYQMLDNLVYNLDSDSRSDFVRRVVIPVLSRQQNPYDTYWWNIAKYLFRIVGEQAIAPLIEVLESSEFIHSVKLKILAVKMLGEISDERAIAAIKNWLDSSIEKVEKSDNSDFISSSIWSNNEKMRVARSAIEAIQKRQS